MLLEASARLHIPSFQLLPAAANPQRANPRPLQEAACAVLLEAAAAKPAVTAAEVAKLRDRFRSKHYIERVLAACAAAQAAQGSS